MYWVEIFKFIRNKYKIYLIFEYMIGVYFGGLGCSSRDFTRRVIESKYISIHFMLMNQYYYADNKTLNLVLIYPCCKICRWICPSWLSASNHLWSRSYWKLKIVLYWNCLWSNATKFRASAKAVKERICYAFVTLASASLCNFNGAIFL